MSPHHFLIHICLIFILQLFGNGESLRAPLKPPKDLAAYPYLSPDRRGDSFAIVDFNFGLSEAENLYQVNLRIENSKNQIYKECSFNFTVASSLAMQISVTSLRRLIGDEEKVVLSWNEGSDENVFRRILAVDLKRDCWSTDLGLPNLPADPIVVPTYEGELDVILAHPARIYRYNSTFGIIGDHPQRFNNAHLDWPTMRVEKLINGNYFVHGFLYPTAYRVMLIEDSTGVKKDLMTLSNVDQSQLKVVSSGATFCYKKNSNSGTSVDCSQFDDFGDVSFEKSTNFDVTAATPLAVRELYDGEFFLLVGNTKCLGQKSCWDFKWAMWVRRDDGSLKPSFGKVKFHCTGGWDNLMFYDVWRSEKLMYYSYACKKGNRYVYHVNSFLGSLM